VPFAPRTFSVDEYHRLLDANVLKRGSRSELLDGVIYEREPRTDRQATACLSLRRRFDQSLLASLTLRADEPLTLAAGTELFPALAVLSNAELASNVRHPSTATLVVEIAAVDLERVRDGHLPAYARAGVNEVWLVNLVDRRVELAWKPSVNHYQSAMVLEAPESVTSRALPGLTIPFAQVFE